MVKQGQSEEFALTEQQLQTLWGQCKEPRDQVLIGLLSYCGMRVSEAIHLRASWIKDEEIHIPSKMACRCWECRKRGYWKPKSKAGIRALAVPSFLKPVLLNFLTKSPEGLTMTRQAAWYRVQILAKNAKIPRIFPHALRATAATLLASKGFTAVELCAYFGWARLEMGDHYIKVSAARIGARDKIKQIWG